AWAPAWPPGRTPSGESPRAPAAHAAAARYAAEASKRLKMSPPPAGPRTRAPADRDCETPSASPYTDSSTVFEIRLESEGLARPCPPTTSASAVSSPIADPAKGIPRKPRPSAALPRTISARSGRRRPARGARQGLGQAVGRNEDVGQAETRGEAFGDARPEEREPAAQRRSDHHPEPEGRTDEPHAARTLGRAGHIGDVRLCHRDARARHAREQTCEEEHPEPPRT